VFRVGQYLTWEASFLLDAWGRATLIFLLGSESSGSGTSRSHCSGARRGSCSSSIESYWVAACFLILHC
jgi:hypothetical protein